LLLYSRLLIQDPWLGAPEILMPDDLDDILELPEHTLLATDLGNTEGPLWHPEGYLTFVDLVGNRLQRWDQTSGVSVVREDTGEGNGCTLDRQGRLLMCEGADRPFKHEFIL
jgi:gluconolactonase